MNIEQAFEKSLIELESKGFDGIREPERVLATIWSVEAEVNNGGFDQLGGLNEQVQHLIDQVRYRYDSLLPPPYC